VSSDGAPRRERPEEKTLAIRFLPGGAVNWQGMQSKTRARLKSIVQDPATTKELGLNAAPGAAGAGAPQLFDPVLCNFLYMALGQIEIAVAVKAGQVDPKVAADVFTYTKEEVAMLTPATTAVMNKYVGPMFLKWKEEIVLGGLLVALHAAKLAQIQAATSPRGPAVVTPIRPVEPSTAAPSDLGAAAEAIGRVMGHTAGAAVAEGENDERRRAAAADHD
jgi:hypothetical protein